MRQHLNKRLIKWARINFTIIWNSTNLLCWEYGLVVDGLLHVGHDVVDVLRGRQSRLFPPVINPLISSVGKYREMKINLK